MGKREKIDPDWTPKELDAFLGGNLLIYSHVLAEVFMETFWGFPFKGKVKRTIKDELDSITKIKEDVLFLFRKYTREYDFSPEYQKLNSEQKRSPYIKKKFSLDFSVLDQREKEIREYISIFPPKKTRGAPVKKRHNIAAIWAIPMGYKKDIYWPTIATLLEWFSQRLSNTAYGNELKLSYKINNKGKYLRRRCSRILTKEFSNAVVYFRFFFPCKSPFDNPFYAYSIDFNKDNINISGIYKNIFITRKVIFSRGKKFYSTDYSVPKERPHITFPEETYDVPASSELLAASISYLSKNYPFK